jgi:hypothetical protein
MNHVECKDDKKCDITPVSKSRISRVYGELVNVCLCFLFNPF